MWQFPRDTAEVGESPEAAMRRLALDDLGLGVQIVVGQPPVLAREGETEIEVRFFFCGVSDGEPSTSVYPEVRWLKRAELHECGFDELSAPVVAWLTKSR